MNILIINPFGIGDVLFSTPLVSALKKFHPKSYIAYICNLKTYDILVTNPDINDVFVFERDEYRFLWKKSKIEAVKKFFNFWGVIRNKRFDIVFDLSLGKEYAFFCWLAGIRDRRGFNYRNRGRFLNHSIPFDGFNDKPIAEYYLDLLGSRMAGLNLPYDYDSVSRDMVLVTTADDKEYADDFLKKSGVGGQDFLIGIAPGGGMSFGQKKMSMRRWPLEKFKELTRRIAASKRGKIILLWGPGEEDLVKEIADYVKESVLLSPKTTAREMAALIRRCRLVICNDSGILHIATAQNVKTVSIFGPADERVYGPYPPSRDNIIVKSGVNCRPCYKKFKLPECNTRKCLLDISVEEVFKTAATT